jgi:hypothetical protein
MKKFCLLLQPLFLHRTRIRDPGSGMNKYSDPDPGSGIKHPGSATLDCMQSLYSAFSCFAFLAAGLSSINKEMHLVYQPITLTGYK